MNEPRTVKVDGGQMGSSDPTAYPGQRPGSPPGGWEETQYAPSDRPTPRPGEVPAWQPQPQPQPPGYGPTPWAGQPPMPGGQATMIMPTGPRPEPSFAWLVTVSGVSNNPYIGQPFPIKSAGTTTIGRVPGNDILVPDPACSSQHAKVRSEPDEEGKQAFVIYDLASTNGLYVGSKADYKEESSRKYRHALHDGDYVLIGETTLVFKQV